MERRITLELKGKSPSDVKELNIDNCRGASTISGLTDEFKSLESLSMISAGITNLKGFPPLENLKKLELSENRIAGGLENLAKCPKLESLNLCSNKLSDLDTLKALSGLPIKKLDLVNNPLWPTSENNTKYRDQVFSILPKLEVLDGLTKDMKESFSSDEDEDEEDLSDSEDEPGLDTLVGDDIDEEDSNSEGFEPADDDDSEGLDDEDDDSEDEEQGPVNPTGHSTGGKVKPMAAKVESEAEDQTESQAADIPASTGDHTDQENRGSKRKADEEDA